METCDITWEALAEYWDGLGDANARRHVDAHLAANCNECQARLDWLTRMASAIAAPTLEPAPAVFQSRARALFRERMHQPAARAWPLIAHLLFDSRAMPTPAFARGAEEQTPSVHRVYTIAGQEIDLWEEPETGDTSYVIGQVRPESGQEAPPLTVATLTSAENKSYDATLEESEFHLARIPPGSYTLTLILGEETVLIPGIVIAASGENLL